MGFLDTVGKINEVISIAKPIIENISCKLQPEMKAFAEKLLVYSEKYPQIKDFAIVIDKSADILGDALFVLGIKTEATDVIGFKIAQADKSITDFNSVEDYLNYLNSEVEIDKERYKQLSEGERIVYSVLGIAAEIEVIGEKIGITLNTDMLMLISKVVEVGKIALDASGIIDFLKMIKENGGVSIPDIYEYFIGSGDSDRVNTGKIVYDIMEKIRPEKADAIIAEFKEEARN